MLIYKKTICAVLKNLQTVANQIDLKLNKLMIREELINNIDLILEEILMNIIEHGYNKCTDLELKKRKVNIFLFSCRSELIIRFEDYCAEYGEVFEKERLPMSKPQIGGVGVLLVKQISDKIEYNRKNEKNILEIHIKR